MKKFIPYLVSGLVICAIYYFYFQPTAPTTPMEQKNTLIVGTSSDYPPYVLMDLASHEIVGFDIDVISQVAQRLGKKMIIKDMPFATLIFSLNAGQMDVIAAGLSATPERAQNLLFANVHLTSDCVVIVSKSDSEKITKIEDLFGKKVAVNTGYIAENYLMKFPEISLVRLEAPADSALALQAGSIDAFATAKSNFNLFIDQQKDQGLSTDYQIFAISDVSENCAFGLNKKNIHLKSEIDTALASMQQDGTLQKIKKKWNLE